MVKVTGWIKKEYEKNFERVQDIIIKSAGDKEKEKSLSRVQANRMTDEYKAINRAFAAKSIGNEDIFEIFFRRAFELGSVGKQEYRDYVLSKLLN